MIYKLFLVIACLAFASCNYVNKKEAVDESVGKSEGQSAVTNKAQPLPQAPVNKIPPNHARIVGTIVQIDDKLTGVSDTPCSQVPCFATIRVDSLLGYGAAFPSTLPRGKELYVHFRLTLSDTQELIPDLNEPLPGLKVNEQFEALVEGLDSKEGKHKFEIFSYTLIKGR